MSPPRRAREIPAVLFLALFHAAAVSPPRAVGCENDYVTNIKAVAASESLVQELTHVELSEPWDVRRDRLRKEVENGADYKTRNDLASALMHTGDPKAAIVILEEIEKTNPGLYQTASNLGTAYELAGDNPKAIEWIRIGIKRNPASHQGSEWLHVKILEAKLTENHNQKQSAASDEPTWTSTGSLLGFDFNSKPPAPPKSLPNGNTGEPVTLDEVESALKYQLRERLQFVKPENEIVAALLYDLGAIIESKPEGPGIAAAILDLAEVYAESGTPRKDEIRMNIMNAASMASHANRTHSLSANRPFVYGMLAVCGVIAYYIVSKKRDARRRRRAAVINPTS